MEEGPHYRIHPFALLLRHAHEDLVCTKAVNKPFLHAGGDSLSPFSKSCVEAQPGRVAFNYASGVIHQMVREQVAQDLPRIESLLYEGMRRMKQTERYAQAGWLVFTDLERETRDFLDDLQGMWPLTAKELMEFAVESVGPLHLAPKATP